MDPRNICFSLGELLTQVKAKTKAKASLLPRIQTVLFWGNSKIEKKKQGVNLSGFNQEKENTQQLE